MEFPALVTFTLRAPTAALRSRWGRSCTRHSSKRRRTL